MGAGVREFEGFIVSEGHRYSISGTCEILP